MCYTSLCILCTRNDICKYFNVFFHDHVISRVICIAACTLEMSSCTSKSWFSRESSSGRTDAGAFWNFCRILRKCTWNTLLRDGFSDAAYASTALWTVSCNSLPNIQLASRLTSEPQYLFWNSLINFLSVASLVGCSCMLDHQLNSPLTTSL